MFGSWSCSSGRLQHGILAVSVLLPVLCTDKGWDFFLSFFLFFFGVSGARDIPPPVFVNNTQFAASGGRPAVVAISQRWWWIRLQRRHPSSATAPYTKDLVTGMGPPTGGDPMGAGCRPPSSRVGGSFAPRRRGLNLVGLLGGSCSSRSSPWRRR